MKRIGVIGSINMDLVAAVEHFPVPGETLTGKEFGTYYGGKGANQAVAASRLLAGARMIAKVGADLYGEQQLANLKQNGVEIEGIGIEKGVASGIALIEVDCAGENRIVVIPGANALVDQAYIDSQFQYLLECDIFLFQLEIPWETVCYAIRKLKPWGKTIILDPAPIRVLPEEIYRYIDFITPNETELAKLTGIPIETAADFYRAGSTLLGRGAHAVIAKAGKNGAYLINHHESLHMPGFQVRAIDTTAAGDTFNAGLAVSLAQGLDLPDCVRFANAAGGLSTTAKGAQSAMPTLAQVAEFMNQN